MTPHTATATRRTAPPATSVYFPIQPDTLEPIVDFARFAQDMGVRRLWMGQSLRMETHLILSALAARVPGLPLGTGVALAPLRHPYQAAIEARTIAGLSGESYVAGFGPGAAEFQRMLMPEPYARPLGVMYDYAATLRRLLDGEQVVQEGEFSTVKGALLPAPAPPVEIGLGVLRPGMARTAGRVADVAITWLTPHSYIADTLRPALAEGAAKEGREPPRVTTVVHVAVTRPARNPLRAVLTAVGPHLGSAHYTDMLRRSGLSADPKDPVQGARTLLDSGVFLTGTPDEIARQLRQHRASGVDEVVLNICGVYFTEGEKAAMRDLREVLEAEASDV
ncbi:LLM class flavin-dependent oxidoreductase [Streptomyces sp. WAC04770]|nr:LLM class flavin-dependent oxidoreductase [Streptomyces sp. WAC04770]RST21052.1 LLM class flavin-dependent oxidoreductase [Streptomyces sp. WAC04770]